MLTAPVVSTLVSSHSEITILTPSSPGYAERRKIRCLNDALEKIEPPAIAAPKSADEVASVVRWCVTNNVPFTVRGGGNDYFGRTLVEGTIVIDTRDINFVRVSEDRRTATIGAGLIMRDLVQKLDAEGLLTPVGNISLVGYVGWATLGGYGPMQHGLGLGIEQIVGAELVTARGEVVTIDEEDERLEGLRGLSGNLGVIAAVKIKVYPKFDLLTGVLIYESRHLGTTIRDYNAAISNLDIPKALTIHMFIMNVPPLGGRHLMVFWTWADADHVAGRAYLETFLAATPPLKLNSVASKSLPDHYASNPPDQNAPWGGMRTQYFSKMTPELTEAVISTLDDMPTDPMCNLSWTGDVSTDTNLKHCIGVGPSHIFFWASFFVSDVTSRDAADKWNLELFNRARKAGAPVMYDAVHPGLTPLGEKILEQQLGSKTARGRELKTRYDPDNVFKYALPRFGLHDDN